MALVLVAAACTTEEASPPPPADAPVNLDANGGTEQIWLRTDPGVELGLYDADGQLVPTDTVGEDAELISNETRTTDENGALVMRLLDAGDGYTVRRMDGTGQSAPISVTAPDQHPDAATYAEQQIDEGYGYLTTRDGTQLAVNVTLPGPVEEGPYPAVIEYSGYDPANPSPSTVTISKTLAGILGFASIGVNIRGSGCSGGSFQLWEDAQALDGYDVVETIAAQDWVEEGKVGMVGISYPAVAMLYTAATRPPSLDAIAPMAAYDDGFRALLWPGGIQNEGFAREWVAERYDQAKQDNPSEWVQDQVAEGDQTCIDNLAMRGQNVDLASLIDAQPFYPQVENLGDTQAPITFVGQIDVPTYMVASWQDEQVGGHAPAMIPEFDDVDDAFFTLMNGYHTSGLAEPSVLQGWLEFLQLYVAREVPDTTVLAGLYPTVTGEVIGDTEAAAGVPIPPERFAGITDYDEALELYRTQQPRVRVLFDNGGSIEVPAGVPTAAFEESFDSYPVPGVEAVTWYLGPDGTLTLDAPTDADDSPGSIDAYTSDPSVRPAVSLTEDSGAWDRLPIYDWAQPVDGNALSYVSPALTDDSAMVGSGSANLWVRSSEADTDLQVTLTEVRPDGQETYVQSGWLRASKRALDEERTTDLAPVISQLRTDAEDLPEGEFVPVRVEIYPFAHVFRADSQVRVTISAPGGDKPVWSFVTLDGTQDNEIARSVDRPSAVVLPVVPGVAVPTGLPACPSLRGQPCRSYAPFVNDTP
jgi:predicted acyl esterase